MFVNGGVCSMTSALNASCLEAAQHCAAAMLCRVKAELPHLSLPHKSSPMKLERLSEVIHTITSLLSNK